MVNWTGRASWPQEMLKIPAPTAVPDTLDWDLWLGGAAARPFTAGDQEYKDFIAARNERSPRGPGGGGGNGRGAGNGGATGGGGAHTGGGGGAGGGFAGAESFGFYLPFNWRGFYDFGSGLIGDWGVHILGPANRALQLSPKSLISVESIKKNTLPPFTFPDELTIKYEFAARGSMPPVTVYWYHSPGGNAYLPPGMTIEQARKIPNTGPQVGPVGEGKLLWDNDKGEITNNQVANKLVRPLFRALIIVSASGQENVRQENGKSSIFLSYIFLSYIFLSYIFLSAGFDGRNDDQGLSHQCLRQRPNEFLIDGAPNTGTENGTIASAWPINSPNG